MLRVVATEAPLEDKVLRERDTFIDSEPVSDDQHEVLQDGFEVAVARDSDGAIDQSTNESPDETWDTLGSTGKELQGQGDGVDVRAVICDDGKPQNDETEFSKAAKWREKHRCEETSDARIVIAIGVVLVIGHSRGDSSTEHFTESEGDDKASKGPRKHRSSGAIDRLVHRVIGGIGSPSRSEAKDGSSEGKNGSSLAFAHAHGDVAELARVGELAKHD